MSEKRNRKNRRSDDPAVKQHRAHSDSASERKRSGKRTDYGTTIKILYGVAIVLAVAACAIIGVKTVEDLQAEKSASTLLNAYKEMETAQPTATALTTATPDAAATPTPDPSATPDPMATPDTTPGPDIEAEVNAHRVNADSDIQVDETGNYVQPEDADTAETEEIIKKIVKAVGDDGVIGTIEIPKFTQEYPIIGKWSYSLLKISICRYLGGDLNQSGKNLVLIGHNYKSGAHFGNLKKLEVGDEIYLTAKGGDRVRYVVYEMVGIEPDDFDAVDKYRGDAGLTLLTCKNNGNNRLIVRCEQKPAESTVSTGTTQTAR